MEANDPRLEHIMPIKNLVDQYLKEELDLTQLDIDTFEKNLDLYCQQARDYLAERYTEKLTYQIFIKIDTLVRTLITESYHDHVERCFDQAMDKVYEADFRSVISFMCAHAITRLNIQNFSIEMLTLFIRYAPEIVSRLADAPGRVRTDAATQRVILRLSTYLSRLIQKSVKMIEIQWTDGDGYLRTITSDSWVAQLLVDLDDDTITEEMLEHYQVKIVQGISFRLSGTSDRSPCPELTYRDIEAVTMKMVKQNLDSNAAKI